MFGFLGRGIQTEVKKEAPPRMPTRRNLSSSLPPQSPRSVSQAQAFDEGMCPLQCTPDSTQKTVQIVPQSSSTTMDPNMTFEVLDNDDETATDASFLVSNSVPVDNSVLSQPLNAAKANEGDQIPTRRWESSFLKLSFNYMMCDSVWLQYLFSLTDTLKSFCFKTFMYVVVYVLEIQIYKCYYLHLFKIRPRHLHRIQFAHLVSWDTLSKKKTFGLWRPVVLMNALYTVCIRLLSHLKVWVMGMHFQSDL